MTKREQEKLKKIAYHEAGLQQHIEHSPSGSLGAPAPIAPVPWLQFIVLPAGLEQRRGDWEMTEGGFGFHPSWNNLSAWIQGVDFDRIKKEGWHQSIT